MQTAKAALGIVSITLALAVHVQAQPFLTNGLVAYYPFNGNANDMAGTNNGVSFSATLTVDRFGNPNSAYSFNGSTSYIQTVHPMQNLTTATFSVWFNANQLPNSTRVVLSDSDTTIGNDWLIALVNTDSGYGLNAQSTKNGTVSVIITNGGASFAQPLTNTWQHFVWVMQPTTQQMYINGGLAASVSSSANDVGYHNAGFVIGAFDAYSPYTEFFSGSIDEVRIYNRALSAHEVSQLYALEAPPLPTITTQPQSITTNLTANVTFTVSATGTNGVWYQWQKDGVTLPNATNSIYAITNLQPAYIGNYDVVVTGYGGSVTSSVASLSISNVYSGIWQGLVAYYPFNGTANDASPFMDNGTVSGATLTTDKFGNANSCYSFSASNQCSITASGVNLPTGHSGRTFALWIKPNYIYPISGYGTESYFGYGVGSSLLTAFLNHDPNTNYLYVSLIINTAQGMSYWTSYQKWDFNNWHQIAYAIDANSNLTMFLDGSAIAANIPSTNVGFNLPPTSLNIGGFQANYFDGEIDDVRIYNRDLSASDVLKLYSSEAVPPSISSQPVSVVDYAYSSPSFTVAAAGSPPLKYQWYLNASAITNATNATLTISNMVQTDIGTYSVTVSNPVGSTNSSLAKLYMYPYIATAFTGAVAYWGQTATLNVDAWGSDISYQWFFNSNAISGATASTYTMSAIQMTNAGLYSVVVSNFFGSIRNAQAQVVVNPAGVALSLNPDLLIQGTVGYSYIIQCSTNLADTNAWITLTNLTLSQPTQYWDDISVQWNQSQRYYRVLPGQ